MTLRVMEELVEFVEGLQFAVVYGSNAPNMRKSIMKEANDIADRNAELKYEDISKVVFAAVKSGTKLYLHRQIIANVLAARMIRDMVVSMNEDLMSSERMKGNSLDEDYDIQMQCSQPLFT